MNRNLSGSILREASRQRVVDMYFVGCVCVISCFSSHISIRMDHDSWFIYTVISQKHSCPAFLTWHERGSATALHELNTEFIVEFLRNS